VVIFVVYMRRFAPALELLKAEIEGKQIRYVRVRDIIGKASVHEADPLCLP
jgi:predicted dehydrogenase